MNNLNWLQAEYPAVATELESALLLPPIPPNIPGESIALLLDDVQLPPDLALPANFTPDLLTLYLADELIFVKAKGEVLLNRLPGAFPIAV